MGRSYSLASHDVREKHDESVEPDGVKKQSGNHRVVSFVGHLFGFVFRVAFAITVGVALAVGIRTYVAEQFVIPTGSMIPAIQINDHVVGEKLSYRNTSPAIGDVVFFVDPQDNATTLCKRIIAVGGQTVDLDGGRVYVDGELSPYGVGDSLELESEVVTYPYEVPAGELWVMGDNRENSGDSRVFGSVSEDAVVAKAWFVVAPSSRIGRVE